MVGIRIWHNYGLEMTTPHILRPRKRPENRRRQLMESGGAIRLSGSHVGGVYRPGVRNSAGEFSSS